jgi:deoxyadenosine/deoxycytidine kinase
MNTCNDITITVSGPVNCGKTAILFKIAEMLQNEFNITVSSEILENEKNLFGGLSPEQYKDIANHLSKSNIVLKEQYVQKYTWSESNFSDKDTIKPSILD